MSLVMALTSRVEKFPAFPQSGGTDLLTYWFTDNFRIGAGYRYVDDKIEHDGSVPNEEIGFSSSGPVVTDSVSF